MTHHGRFASPILWLWSGLMSLLLAVLIVYGGWIYWLRGTLSVPLTLLITRGQGARAIADVATQHGFFHNEWVGYAILRFWGKAVKHGEYAFPAGLSRRAVLEALHHGDYLVWHKLTIPEGQTSWKIAETINALPLLDGPPVAVPPEGTVMPETYYFHRGDRRSLLLQRMTTAMEQAVQAAWRGRKQRCPLSDPQKLVTLASIIEKETGLEPERTTISGVFCQRLQRGMKLQADPTVVYALTLGQTDLNRPLTRDDLAVDSPYNTYRYEGLPPTPITNPGRASLVAAAQPADTEALYFVANGEGGHTFATSLKQHNQAVTVFRRRLNAKKRSLRLSTHDHEGGVVTKESRKNWKKS